MAQGMETSPQLSRFFDQIIQTPTDINALKNALKEIKDSEERYRALEAINTTTGISIEARKELRLALIDGTEKKPLPKPSRLSGVPIAGASAAGIADYPPKAPGKTSAPAQTPAKSEASTSDSGKAENQTPEKPETSAEIAPVGLKFKKIAEYGETPEGAKKLFKKITGKEASPENIKEFQRVHLLKEDGILGNQTFLELKTVQALSNIQEPKGKIENIKKPDVIDSILFSLNNPSGGTSYAALFLACGNIRDRFKNESGYEEAIQKLDNFFDTAEQNPNIPKPEDFARSMNTPVVGPDGKSRTFLGGIMDFAEGKITGKEFFQNFKGPMFIAGIIGFILFGNKIPGLEKIPGMGNWFGRIAWLVGGAALGGAEFINRGMGHIQREFENAGNYQRSPEAQTVILEGRDKAENVFKSAWNWGTEKWEDVKEWLMPQYDEFTKRFESKNQAEKTAGPNGTPSDKYIEKYSEKHGVIFSDEKFLRTPINTFTSLPKNKAGLEQVLSTDSFNKLVNEYHLTDGDAKNFLDMYILPAIKEAKDAGRTLEIWGDVYMSDRVRSTLQDTVENVTEWLALPFFMTASLDSEIKTELSTLLFTGSPAQQEAARNLGYKLSIGKFDEFKLENFPELKGDINDSTTELGKFNELIKEIRAIRIQENILKNYINSIKGISIPNYENISPDVIKDRWTILQTQKTQYTSKRAEILAVGVTTETLDAALAAKEIEILKAARDAGITSLPGVSDVRAEIAKSEQTEMLAQQVSQFQEYLENLEDLPSEDATPLVLKKWYENNEKSFSAAEKDTYRNAPNLQNGSNEKIIADAANTILQRKADFITLYEKRKADYVTKFSDLKTKITSFNLTTVTTATDFEAKQNEYQNLFGQYGELMSQIQEGWVSHTASEIKKYVSDYIKGNFTFPSSDIAFANLDTDTKSTTAKPDYDGVKTSLETKKEELKKVFQNILGNVDIASLRNQLDPIVLEIKNALQSPEFQIPEFSIAGINLSTDFINGMSGNITKVNEMYGVIDSIILQLKNSTSTPGISLESNGKIQSLILFLEKEKEKIVAITKREQVNNPSFVGLINYFQDFLK